MDATRKKLIHSDQARVAILMGSQSDWSTMVHSFETLNLFSVSCVKKIVSAHRTPERLFEVGKSLEASGVEVVIAGAGGAAHLPGMIASLTILPVLGVPILTQPLNGQDSLYSIVQMPAGVPVGTLAIGKSGAINASLLAVSILALTDRKLKEQLRAYRSDQTQSVSIYPEEVRL